MMGLLANFDFKQDGSQLVMRRIALLHAILTSKRCTDGYSKLIFKSDLDKMKGSLKDSTKQIEDLLLGAWKQTLAVMKTGEGEKASFAFGKLSVRLILVLLAKQKHSRDTVEFDSFEEVVQRFTDELTGRTISSSSHAGDEKKVVCRKVQDLLEASASDMALLQNPHLTLGSKRLT